MKKIKFALLSVILLYLILLIPDKQNENIQAAGHTQFVWDRDSLWFALENQFDAAKQIDSGDLSAAIGKGLTEISAKLDSIQDLDLYPNSILFEHLNNSVFHLAPMIGAETDSLNRFIELVSRMRQIVKSKSKKWNPNEPAARNTIYKLLYGGRASVEEILLQSGNNTPPLTYENQETSSAPYTTFLGVKIHSGDILLSRGDAPTSALISRGNDYPGNFSHVALVYIDPETNAVSIIEAHIEVGAAIASLNDYMNDKKLRVMILRLRSDLPQIIADPMLPHKAASAALHRVLSQHIPYDFEMDYKNDDKLFCSEVASSVYSKLGIDLWMNKSTISSPGTARLLAGFGVTNFLTQDPSDLEYDPQLSVIAEWRNKESLFQDHIDNAVVDAILEWSDRGNEIYFDWYLLPVVRVVKLYSSVLNLFNAAGPVPEGMSAASALKHTAFNSLHNSVKQVVLEKAGNFKKQYGYTAPYWRLLDFARSALDSGFNSI